MMTILTLWTFETLERIEHSECKRPSERKANVKQSQIHDKGTNIIASDNGRPKLNTKKGNVGKDGKKHPDGGNCYEN